MLRRIVLITLVAVLASCDTGRPWADADYLALSRDDDDLVIVAAPCSGEVSERSRVFGNVSEGRSVMAGEELELIQLKQGFGEIARVSLNWDTLAPDATEFIVTANWSAPDDQPPNQYFAQYRASPESVARWPTVTRFNGTEMTFDEFLRACDHGLNGDEAEATSEPDANNGTEDGLGKPFGLNSILLENLFR